MIPYELTLRNFMCYRDELPPLCLDGVHVACLAGENGAGKSALIDAITWVLWGKARMSDDDLVAQGAVEMLVDLSFVLNGQRYRVTRKRQRGRTGPRGGTVAGKSTLDLQVQNGKGWQPIGGATIRETEQQIERLLRMSYDTFINASFLLQGRADEFTRKTAGERKQVLADILDLHEYAALEERARRKARALEDEIRGLEGLIGHLQGEADKLALYSQLVSAAEARVAAAGEQQSAAEDEHQQATALLQTLEVQATRRDEVQTRLVRLRSDLQGYDEQIAALQAQIANGRTVLTRSDEITAGVAALTVARAEQQRLTELRPRYDELIEARRRLQDELKDARRGLESERDQLRSEQQRLAAQVAAAESLTVRRAELQQQQQMLAELAGELATLQASAEQLDVKLQRVTELLLRQRDLVSQVDKRQDSLVSVREEEKRNITRLDRQLADLTTRQRELAAAEHGRQQAHELSQQLADLRSREQSAAEQVGELRATCARYKQLAEQIKQDRERLATAETTSCPVCRSELGRDGFTHVLTHYDDEIADLRVRYRQSNQAAQQLETELAELRNAIAACEPQVATAQAAAARYDLLHEQVAQAEERQRELATARARLDNVEQQLAAGEFEPALQAELVEVERELRELGVLVPERSGRRRPVPDPAPLETERATLRKQISEREKQLQTRATIESELARLDTAYQQATEAAAASQPVTTRLAQLEQQLADGAFAGEIRAAGRAVETQIAELGYTPAGYEAAVAAAQQLEHWLDEQRQLDVAQYNLERDELLLKQTSDLRARNAADCAALEQEAAQLAEALRALTATRRRVEQATATLYERRQTLTVAQNDLAEKRAQQQKATEAERLLAKHQATCQQLRERRALFQELAEACGKRGVQAMLIETAIPEIEREANRLLGRMTDNQMHLTFEMQRDTRRGDTVETLEIKIADALGTRIYDAFSGGEAMRVNFAIRIALSRLLARRAGASLETLVIDEGFGTLDAVGRERFVEAITSVQADFQRILVITHIDELKERFPAQITITKTGRGSTWELY